MGSQIRAASAASGDVAAPTAIAVDDPVAPHSSEVAASLYADEKPGLMRRLRRSVTGSDEALDIVHDAFVRLLGLGPARLNALARQEPGAYLNRATTNLVRDRRKTSLRRSADFHVVLDETVSDGRDPHGQLEARDELRRFEAIIAQLPARPRSIYVAHRVHGLSYGEIAAQLGISVKGVEKHMASAIRAIDRLLDRD